MTTPHDPALDALRLDPFAVAAAFADATESGPQPASPEAASEFAASYSEAQALAAEVSAVPTRHQLPERWTEPTGVLDVDALRTLAPQVRDGLIDAIRTSVQQHRTARGTVVVPEDTYELVRRTTAAQEVLTQWAQAFQAAAKECTAILEEEALTANGGLPGYEEAPAGSLFVPDGTGQRIAVTPDWKAADSTWDVDTLAAWVAEQTVADEGRSKGDADALVWSNNDAVSLCRDAIDRLRHLGTYTPGIKLLDAERKRLAGLGRDSDAAVLRQVRQVGLRQYRGVKVTREDAK